MSSITSNKRTVDTDLCAIQPRPIYVLTIESGVREYACLITRIEAYCCSLRRCSTCIAVVHRIFRVHVSTCTWCRYSDIYILYRTTDPSFQFNFLPPLQSSASSPYWPVSTLNVPRIKTKFGRRALLLCSKFITIHNEYFAANLCFSFDDGEEIMSVLSSTVVHRLRCEV